MIGFNGILIELFIFILGAGLYSSLSVSKIEDIELTLKTIYASIFSHKAFEEREFYKIDHSKVAMAVLVQPFLSDTVISKGVAMTYSQIRSY
jgi:phosphoenolpyruvate synthase/pyruvate phosphate dikinase